VKLPGQPITAQSARDWSTTRRISTVPPVLGQESDSTLPTRFLLPAHPNRQGAGGLRLQGKYKSGGYFDKASATSPAPDLVSLITVVYNCVTHLEKTILSVLGQSYDNVEYIIIDGGSTDGTLELIRKYEYAIDYWVSEPDGGISRAFNKGISTATGRLLGFVNADDWYELDAARLAASASKTWNADIIHGQLQYWSGREVANLVSGNHELLKRDMTINHPTVFARLALYKRIGGFDPDFCCAMDYEWIRRAQSQGSVFHYLPTTLSNMSLGGVSDVRWRAAIREVALVKLRYSPDTLGPWISYGFQLTRGIVRRILEKAGLIRIVHFYHAYFSLVRKVPGAGINHSGPP
jgi:glycosyltransferase involved in cell wall biosynthesis